MVNLLLRRTGKIDDEGWHGLPRSSIGDTTQLCVGIELQTRRSAQAPVWVATTQIGMLYAGSTLLTPLYRLYREAFGFSPLTLTLIYSAYVLGNLTALLLLGRLSDQLGRRAVNLGAVAIGALATVLFLFASSPAWLFRGPRCERPRDWPGGDSHHRLVGGTHP
jgi:predicted MFS family arabinose efflux permease